jgi:carboxypeptidase PM20D1
LAPTDRTVYLCFGHDEEIGGKDGAHHISRHLAREEELEKEAAAAAAAATAAERSPGPPPGPFLEFMLDEGLFIVDGIVPGHKKPVAMVCVAEKGSLTTRLSVSCDPGHSSAPPSEGAIGILSRAVDRLERNPMPCYFDIGKLMFGALNGGFSWPMQPLFTNLWLFGPLVLAILGAKPKTSTMVRTTTALTIFQSGDKDNVLPPKATAYVNQVRTIPSSSLSLSLCLPSTKAKAYCVNQRIHPRDCVASCLKHIQKTIRDPRVHVEVMSCTEPSAISSSAHPAFKHTADSVLEIWPDVAVAPGLFVAASDSKHFWGQAEQIYRYRTPTACVLQIPACCTTAVRSCIKKQSKLTPVNPLNPSFPLCRFNPITIKNEETNMFHGCNERIGVDNYAKLVAFYRTFHLRQQGMVKANKKTV